MTTHEQAYQEKMLEMKEELNEVYHAVAGLTVELDRARENLSQTNVRLEERVEERTRELESAVVEANRANHAKSDFLAAMSHEIRTPMNGVVGMIDLLLLSELDDKQKQMAQTVSDSAHALLRIINDILDFSKIEAGKIELESTALDINDMVNGVAKILLPNANKNNVELLTYVDPQLCGKVEGDLYRIRQILFNLAGNAVKFIPERNGHPGRVMIRVSKIRDLNSGKALIRFNISDNGIGIPEDKLEMLFEKFTQADYSTTRKFGGTGLGLAICKGLTELMEGHINVHSVPDKGACFSVNLPLRCMSSTTLNKDFSKACMLLMIQDEDLREDLLNYLEYWLADVVVITTPTKLEALLQSSSKRFNLVIVDEQELGCVGLAHLDTLLKDHQRMVLLSRNRECSKGQVQPNRVVVENYPLHRAQFIGAIAVCAGLESPEVPANITESCVAHIEPRQAPSIEEAEQQGRLILIAEDNPQNQTVLRMQLDLLGYAAEFYDDGELALAAFRQKRYGLIMTDCHMPNMDGYELTRQIRELEAESGKYHNIIAITANALQGESEHCLEIGMDDYISKPVELKLLEKRLRKWLPDNQAETNDKSLNEPILSSAVTSTVTPSTTFPETTALAPADEIDSGATSASEKTKEDSSKVQPTECSDAINSQLEKLPLLEPNALTKIVGDDKQVHAMLLQEFAESLHDTLNEMHTASKKNNSAVIQVYFPHLVRIAHHVHQAVENQHPLGH